jgi:hypothetical protein
MAEVIGIDKAYEDLANAIVIRALEDYRDIFIGCTSRADKKYVNHEELMRFFKSEWCEQISVVDINALLEQLNKIVDRYVLRYDITKEKGGRHYNVVDLIGYTVVEGPFKNKDKAMHRAAELQGIEYVEYMKVRRMAYRDKDK